MTRVLLADDEGMIRAGVRSILETDPDIEVIAEAANGHEAIEMTIAHRPDIVLLDIRMPRLDGLAALPDLRRVAPETKVIMLTTFDEDEYVARALDEGASGFLLKASDPRELLIGVHAVADGGAYLSPRIAQRVITRMRGGSLAGLSRENQARKRVATLTGREQEVLALLGKGLSNRDIARSLFVAEGTIKAHVSTILTRLEVDNRVQAAIAAYEAGLVAATS